MYGGVSPAPLHRTLRDALLRNAHEETEDIRPDARGCLDNQHIACTQQVRRQARMHLCTKRGRNNVGTKARNALLSPLLAKKKKITSYKGVPKYITRYACMAQA